MNVVTKVLFLTGLMVGCVATAGAQTTLYSCGKSDASLHTIDPDTGATLTTTPITLGGGGVDGCNGLTTHPQTQELWAIIRAGGARNLAVVDPATGNATSVGTLSTGFAGIAFACNADLFGVTGDGASPAETLFALSTADASETQLLTLGLGDDGETIGFNPVDGLLYHASGHTDACAGDDEGVCFESIDLTTLTTTPIDISSTSLIDEEAQALTWSSDHGAFYWKQDHGTGPLFRVSADGTSVTNLGEMDHQAKGLTFVPSPCTITNAATLANVRVTKVFTDGVNPTEVTVSLDCNGGLIVDQDKVITEGDANFVNFVVKDFTDGELNCNVVEDTDALPGYIASYAAGVISQQAGDQVGLDDDAEGCHFTGVTGGAELSCVVTNDAAPQQIVITKLWQFEGSVTPADVDTGYHLTLHCDGAVIENGDSACGDNQGGERIGGNDNSEGLYWCKRFANSDFDSSGTFNATVIPQYPGNSCHVEEKTDSNYIEVDNGCGGLSVSAKDGGDSCTITNLVFFEGIPTLSEYGLAMLALLMLGVGLVGFRRFA